MSSPRGQDLWRWREIGSGSGNDRLGSEIEYLGTIGLSPYTIRNR